MTSIGENRSSPNTNGGILALVTEAYSGRGGIAQYNRDFLNVVAGALSGLPVEVLTRLPERDDVGVLPRNVIQPRVARGKLAYSLSVLRAARRSKPTIVFCGHLYMAPLASLAASIAGAKLVIQIHGIEIWTDPTALQRRAIEASDLVLCVSRDTRRRVLAAAGIAPHKVRVLSNTVASGFVPGDRVAARSEFGWPTDRFILLSVGRLDPAERYEGHDRVIEALPRLLAAKPNVHYVIAGEGADKTRLEALAIAKQVGDAVTFLGHVAPGRLASLYRAADLFVLPSTGEGFGIVYLEAMACGTPAIGLAVAGAKDALVDGHLGEAQSEDQFVDTLLRSLGARTVNSLSLATAVRRHFGPQAFAARAAELIRSVRSTPNRPYLDPAEAFS